MKKVKEKASEIEFKFSLGKKGYIRLRKTGEEIRSKPKWLKTLIIQIVITLAFFTLRYVFPR
ncbi:hypothetical protein IFT92_26045 [Peribacillus simplex]|uniref:hypothetical protein n=1 Tax=Peribacillus simplex TaxID=1478 RepID=UPI0019208D23|nr:hypothetical protein [Peribacillus simplex]MBD8591203.1 hypothetical protein [Peribacillus simplex]